MKQLQQQILCLATLCVALTLANPQLKRNPYVRFGAYDNDYQRDATKCKMVNLVYAECIAKEGSSIGFYNVDFGTVGAKTIHIEAAIPVYTYLSDSLTVLIWIDEVIELSLELPSSGSLTTFNDVIANFTFNPPLQGVHDLGLEFSINLSQFHSPLCAIGDIYFEELDSVPTTSMAPTTSPPVQFWEEET